MEYLIAGLLVVLAHSATQKNMDCRAHATTWWLYCALGMIGIITGQIYLHSQGVGLPQQIENNLGSRDEYPVQYRSPYQ